MFVKKLKETTFLKISLERQDFSFRRIGGMFWCDGAPRHGSAFDMTFLCASCVVFSPGKQESIGFAHVL